ncbi:unnamed protein product [Menidia menidia]|uniref:(Atlantic silverside) hypothetical protein n=1 Tax=Menidia menidia TaxID=238744 RepID=A0A8S4AMK7_9TELE|nr:unnamed protein product [Menidia menidia]
MARTKYHYYEFGNKTSKLLAWQIKKEDNEKFIQSIKTDDAIIPLLSSKKQLSTMTSNPLILTTYNAWLQLHTLLNIKIQLSGNTPRKDNPSIPQPIAHGILQTWVRKGIRSVGNLYINNVFASFDQLSEFYDLHRHNYFKYLQIRHWIKSQTVEVFPNKPEETLLESCLLDPKRTTTKGLISCVYKIVLDSSPAYDKYSKKSKWELDLNCNYDDNSWNRLLNSSQTILTSTKHRQIQFNILHRIYYTPYRLNKLNASITDKCQRCRISVGDLLHMLWNCARLQTYWNNVIQVTSSVCGLSLEPDPKIWILGDVMSLKLNSCKKYFVLLASSAAKKCILKNWKSMEPPNQKHWINELLSYCTPEKILHSVRGTLTKYDRIWTPFLDTLTTLDLRD